MLILQRSLVLKVETKTRRILRTWIANESKKDAYAFVRKYMILIVDKDNDPQFMSLYNLLRKDASNSNSIDNFANLGGP